jgi:glutamate dehydrogenase
MRPQWSEIEALDNRVDAETQLAMLLGGRRLVERGARWLLRNRPQPLSITPTVEHFEPGVIELYESLPRLLAKADLEPLAERAGALREKGVDEHLAMHVASLAQMVAALDITEVAGETGREFAEVAAVHFQLGHQLQLHWLRDRILMLPRDDRWSALARSALRDDLYTLHRALTSAVLQADGLPDGDAEKRVHAWIESSPAAERCLETLADIRVGRVFDMTTLPVAVREVRNLIQQV